MMKRSIFFRFSIFSRFSSIFLYIVKSVFGVVVLLYELLYLFCSTTVRIVIVTKTQQHTSTYFSEGFPMGLEKTLNTFIITFLH
jgi:hypothetical protein